MAKKALVIQGGGFRTAFTAGVLDAFIAQNYDPFDIYVGTSGGANAMSYFLDFTYKKCIASIHVLLEDPKFINYKQILKSRIVMNVDFFEEVGRQRVPLDLDKIFERHSEKKIGIVATNRLSGEANYLVPNYDNWIECLMASCAIPFVTKANYEVNGIPYLDGSWSDPLPVKWAVEQGATEVLLIRTSAAMHERQSIPDLLGEKYYKNDPGLAEIFAKSYQRFNAAIAYISSPPAGVSIHQIVPELPLKTRAYTNSINALNHDYRYGLEVGTDFLLRNN